MAIYTEFEIIKEGTHCSIFGYVYEFETRKAFKNYSTILNYEKRS